MNTPSKFQVSPEGNTLSRWIRLALTLLLPSLGLLGCSTLIAPPQSAESAASYQQAMATFDAVLKKHVDAQGRVNFVAIAQAPQALESVVRFIANESPANRPAVYDTPQKVLAYHINAYNALAMYAVVKEGIPQALKGFTFFRFFLFNRVVVGGESMSLYSYENKIIRKLGDPRIHFALNCMSVGCPQLPQDIFEPTKLNQQLDAEAREFFADPRQLVVKDNVVMVSEILKFFTEDFLAAAPSLQAYINKYAPTPVPMDSKIEFIKYDWTVNRWPNT
ncbi:MAG: DUF547 domain-containing protein [Limnobacter sp.]|nr:DUF547 domain-containing protein [Limnobacter sp.]